jgi:histidyl-tRNA synthetase
MKPSIQTLKGFRDFLPAEKRARDFVAEKIKTTFTLFGFEPLETPTLEYADLLLGKYGNEADQLVYTFKDRGDRAVGLRYDQTVPTARVLAQYQHQLPKYFRRYQMQNVFRADKPQQGRYREFTQCDADIFGSTSPLADAEILAVFYQIYADLGFKRLLIKVNDRQTLIETVKPFATSTTSLFSIIQTLDKLDKLGQNAIQDELLKKGLSEKSVDLLLTGLTKTEPSPNLTQIISFAKSLGVPASAIEFNANLARGLDYYTGLIFEAFVEGFVAGSVGAGGRYDNLINDLSQVSIPAVGFGLGFDRTVESATTLKLIPSLPATAKILITIFDQDSLPASLKAAQTMRQAQIPVQIYPAEDKINKQLAYANNLRIPFVLIVGPEEIDKNVVTLKNMTTGDQTTDSLEKIIAIFRGK